VHCPSADDRKRPLCCGRTFFSAGLLDEARVEAQRTLEALAPFVARGVPVVGLEPSCLLTLRDEYQALLPGEQADALSDNAFLFEEFLLREHQAGRLPLTLKPLPQKHALVHGHCHQKAFAVMGSVRQVLELIPELKVELIESSCCGMAGSFGYEAEHYDTSMAMANLSLIPAIAEA
ncbi:MAG TPA: FAD-binding oxidoreductase, partial [Gammaproteobacteria bacterium]|nr:FAD-binding oxidoreductase [Gammaproteobacteria bacterium]